MSDESRHADGGSLPSAESLWEKLRQEVKEACLRQLGCRHVILPAGTTACLLRKPAPGDPQKTITVRVDGEAAEDVVAVDEVLAGKGWTVYAALQAQRGAFRQYDAMLDHESGQTLAIQFQTSEVEDRGAH